MANEPQPLNVSPPLTTLDQLESCMAYMAFKTIWKFKSPFYQPCGLEACLANQLSLAPQTAANLFLLLLVT